MEKLREQLGQLDTLENDYAEAQKINEDLLKELEKRDQAIQEAVEMICTLEATLEKLEQHVRVASPSQSNASSKGETTEQCVTQSPPTLVGSTVHAMPVQDASIQEDTNPSSSPPRKAWKRPSFLRGDNDTAPALRELCQGDGEDGSLAFSEASRPTSAFSEEADGFAIDRQMLRSPALSMLSESSFVSVYGRAHELSPPRVTLPPPKRNGSISWEDKLAQPLARRGETLQRGLSQKGNVATEERKKPPAAATNSHIGSIEQVLESPRRLTQTSPQKAREREVLQYLSQEREKDKERREPRFGGPMFGHRVLPPTPDTSRTGTTATSSMNSINADKSFHNGAATSDMVYPDVPPTANRRLKDNNYRVSTSEGDHDEDHHSEDEVYSTFAHQGGDEEDNARAFLTNKMTAIKRMGLHRADTQGYGADTMFNGTDYLSMDYSNSRSRNRRSRGSTYSATQETSNSSNGRHIASSPRKAHTKSAKARDVTFHEDQRLPRSQSSLNSQDQVEDQRQRLGSSSTFHESKSKHSSPEKANTRPSAVSPTHSKRSSPLSQSQAPARQTLASRLFRRVPTQSSTKSSATPESDVGNTHGNIPRSQSSQHNTTSKHLHRASIASLSTPPRNSSEESKAGARAFRPALSRIARRPGTAGSLDSVPRTRPRPLSTNFGGRGQALGLERHMSTGDPRASSMSLDLRDGDGAAQRGFDDEGEEIEADGGNSGRKAEGRRWGLGLPSIGGGRAASLRLKSGFGNGFGWKKERSN